MEGTSYLQYPYVPLTDVRSSDGANCWHSIDATDQWWQIELPEPLQIDYLAVGNRKSGVEAIEYFMWQGSNDGTTWDDIRQGVVTAQGPSGGCVISNIDADPYKFYRIYVQKCYQSNWAVIGRIDIGIKREGLVYSWKGYGTV